MSRAAFRFDLNLCTGCAACQVACIIENELPYDRSWRQVTDVNAAGSHGLPAYHLSIACNHCETAVCMQACPTLAYARDAGTGAILIDANKCMGCNYCAWACPYDAPKFNQQAGVMEKCTFCAPRLSVSKQPACVTACPTAALQMTQTENGFNQQRVAGFTEAGIGPAVELVALQEGREVPDMQPDPALQALIDQAAQPVTGTPATSGLGAEWPLLLLTWCAPILFGLLAANRAAGSPVIAFVFAGAGLLLMSLATVHLGRKQRAWRAILGWRTSWLSREIILWSAFVGAGFLYLLTGASAVWSAPVLLVGAAALLSMDRVYAAIDAWRGPRLPSSSALLSGLLFVGIFSDNVALVSSVLFIKLVLYVFGKANARKEDRRLRPALTVLRLALGFLLPALALFGPGTAFDKTLLPTILIAEFLDRAEFYLNLELVSSGRR